MSEDYLTSSDSAFMEQATTLEAVAAEAIDTGGDELLEGTPDDGASEPVEQENTDPVEESDPDDVTDLGADDQPADEDPELDTELEAEDDADESDDDPAELPVTGELSDVLAPLDHNGKPFNIRSVEEARQLMQRGLQSASSSGQSPNDVQVLAMLQQQGLHEPEKLGYLLDLAKHDKGAIAKLLHDSGIDPLDLEAEPEAYTPGDHTPDMRKVALENVVDSIRGSEHYQKTMQVVTQEWDEGSRSIISENPQLLTALNKHISDGTYDTVVQEVQRIRVFGGLQGMSDIEAYRTVGDQLFGQAPTASPAPAVPPVPPAPVPAAKPINKARKKAAASARSTKPARPATKPHPLAISDAEFERLYIK